MPIACSSTPGTGKHAGHRARGDDDRVVVDRAVGGRRPGRTRHRAVARGRSRVAARDDARAPQVPAQRHRGVPRLDRTGRDLGQERLVGHVRRAGRRARPPPRRGAAASRASRRCRSRRSRRRRSRSCACPPPRCAFMSYRHRRAAERDNSGVVLSWVSGSRSAAAASTRSVLVGRRRASPVRRSIRRTSLNAGTGLQARTEAGMDRGGRHERHHRTGRRGHVGRPGPARRTARRQRERAGAAEGGARPRAGRRSRSSRARTSPRATDPTSRPATTSTPGAGTARRANEHTRVTLHGQS